MKTLNTLRYIKNYNKNQRVDTFKTFIVINWYWNVLKITIIISKLIKNTTHRR